MRTYNNPDGSTFTEFSVTELQTTLNVIENLTAKNELVKIHTVDQLKSAVIDKFEIQLGNQLHELRHKLNNVTAQLKRFVKPPQD